MLRYNVDLKVEQLLKLSEFSTPGVNEKEVENPLLRNFNSRKQENWPLHRRFKSNREKKNSRSVASPCSDDTDKLKVSKSLPNKVDLDNAEQNLKETVEVWKKNSKKIRKKNCWYFLHSKCMFGAKCKNKHDETIARRHFEKNINSSSETEKDGKKIQILDTVQSSLLVETSQIENKSIKEKEKKGSMCAVS